MSRNGSGLYTLPAPAPFQNGTTIDAPGMNTVQTDIAAALTASIAADGQTPITGNFDWSSYDLLDVGAFSATQVAMGIGACAGVFSAANGTATTQVVNYQQFAATNATTGSQAYPTGGLEKWGTGSTTNGVGTVTFGTAFPTACHNVQITVNGGSVAVTINPLVVGTVTAAGFDVWGDVGQSLTFFWTARGS